jgi:hypothetical protein
MSGLTCTNSFGIVLVQIRILTKGTNRNTPDKSHDQQVPFDFAQGRLSTALPRISCRAWGPGAGGRTAGPSASPDFLSRLVGSRTPCDFPYRKPHTLLSLTPQTENPGTLGMTKFRFVLSFTVVMWME